MGAGFAWLGAGGAGVLTMGPRLAGALASFACLPIWLVFGNLKFNYNN